jgi:hypothetical protein
MGFSRSTKTILIILTALFAASMAFWVYTSITSETFRCNKINVGIQKALNPGGSTPLTRYDIDFCLYHEGWDRKSEKVCSLIEGQSQKDECYWVVSTASGNKRTCDKIMDAERKSYCYFDVAKLQGDVTVCDSALGLQANAGSKENCLLNIAYASKNPDVCLKLENKDIRESCLSYIAQ